MTQTPTLSDRLQATESGSLAADLIPIYAGIASAALRIGAALQAGELGDGIGLTGETNVHGELVKKLDLLANNAFLESFAGGTGHALAGIVSEEMEQPFLFDRGGHYFLMIDPLDGSSNIDNNITVGSIFSIVPHPRPGQDPVIEDFLRPGRSQVAAGYVMFGAATLLVTAASGGVDVYTLDELEKSFRLTRAGLKIPDGATYSINDSGYPKWTPAMQRVADGLRRRELLGEKSNARYVGSLIADAHRTLLHGGCFFYPGEAKKPQGKLRLLYEACPMAWLFEKAGGKASDGQRPILDIQPDEIHQRIPLLLGSPHAVDKIEAALKT